MNRRRFLLVGLATTVAVPLASKASQQPARPRVGWLTSSVVHTLNVEAFRQAMRTLGYADVGLESARRRERWNGCRRWRRSLSGSTPTSSWRLRPGGGRGQGGDGTIPIVMSDLLLPRQAGPRRQPCASRRQRDGPQHLPGPELKRSSSQGDCSRRPHACRPLQPRTRSVESPSECRRRRPRLACPSTPSKRRTSTIRRPSRLSRPAARRDVASPIANFQGGQLIATSPLGTGCPASSRSGSSSKPAGPDVLRAESSNRSDAPRRTWTGSSRARGRPTSPSSSRPRSSWSSTSRPRRRSASRSRGRSSCGRTR